MDDIDRIRERMLNAAERAVTAAANDLMGRAVEDAPIEEGTLKGSARVDVDRTAGGVEATVSFNTPYAAAQEMGHATQHRGGKTVEWVVRQHPGGGRSHYLGSNLIAMVARYERIIGETVRQAVEHP